MISVVIIGYGNVAQHLYKAFIKTPKVMVKQVYARDLSKLATVTNTPVTNNLANLKEADVYIIAVSDDVISTVSAAINPKKGIVVHTSGSVSLQSLQNNGKKGVFYPLQSFSKDKRINFDEIPFCLETESVDDYTILENLALAIGKKTYPISSIQRQRLHVAAVFVNNFVNHMYTIGHDVCNEYNVPFEVLHPLIAETATKIQSLPPKEAQTGPAKRKDQETINNHMALLNEEQQNIYKILTKSIQNG